MPSSGYGGWRPDRVQEDSVEAGRFVAENQEAFQPKISAKVEVREVSSFAAVRPDNMEKMKACELQALCNQWGVHTSGSKQELIQSLNDLFAGKEVPKKRCTLQFVRLVEEDAPLKSFDRQGVSPERSGYNVKPWFLFLRCPGRTPKELMSWLAKKFDEFHHFQSTTPQGQDQEDQQVRPNHHLPRSQEMDLSKREVYH